MSTLFLRMSFSAGQAQQLHVGPSRGLNINALLANDFIMSVFFAIALVLAGASDLSHVACVTW